MLGFAKLTREVGVAHDAAAPELGLKILSEAALLAGLEPAQAGPAAAPAVSEPAAVKPIPVARAAASARPAAQQPAAFQRVQMNQSAATSVITSEGAIKTEEIADLNQSAANSFIVQGSLSSAAGLPQQNDWGMGGRGMGPDGMGGPGMGGPGMGGPGMGGPGGDGAGGTTVMAAGGRGAPGAVGGGPGGGGPGGGGPGGGGPGGGGPGGGGPGGGGPGGGGPEMGGRGGGRGGPDWQGRPNAMAFGNGRRDQRMTYNGNASFSLDNSAWDARTYSVTGASVDKPAYANGRGSVMFGGPLRIPKLVSASKRILFTFEYQMQRNR